MNYGRKSTSLKEKQHAAKRNTTQRQFSVILLKMFLLCLLLLIVIGGCAVFGLFKGIIDSAPDIDNIDPTPTGFLSTVLDADGNEITTLVASGSNRVYVHLEDIPVHTQNAFIAIEDERFYSNNGIDIPGIIRAGIRGIAKGFKFTEGASTITQQLLKNNVFVGWTEESKIESVERKIQEQYLAVQLTKRKSKGWILENYLNTINLGQNTLGIQAASRRYFGKEVEDLTLSESACIAAITQNPSKWNPISHPENNAERRKTVLSYMLEQGMIDREEYEEAVADDVYARIQQVNIAYGDTTPNSYFVDGLIDQVIQDLMDYKGYTSNQAYKALYEGGLTIYSTQDSALQAICDEEINNPDNYPDNTKYSFSYSLTVKKADGKVKTYTEQSMLNYYRSEKGKSNYNLNFNSKEAAAQAIEAYKAEIVDTEAGDTILENGESVQYTLQPQTAVVLMDQHSGEVKAIVGGRGEKTGSRTLNRATNTTRQPGSTFKVLAAYAPALDTAGMTLATVQDDAPYTYSNGASIKNVDGAHRGFITIRQGIIESVNITAVKTLTDISPQVGYDYLLNFGFTTLKQTDIGQPLAIGGITDGVTNLELTAAYAAIANGGTYTAPRFYTKILDHNGNVLIDNTPQTRTVLKETTAFLLTSAMQDVVTQGGGSSVNFDNMDIAGKTGTTNDSRDRLFAGFTPYYTCVTWGGFDDNMSQNNYSTRYPLIIWRAIMERAHKDLEYKEFERPEGLTEATICTKSGKLAVEGMCDCDPRGSMVRTEYFANGTAPTEYCDHHVKVTICGVSGMIASEGCPAASKSSRVYITGGSAGSADGSYLLPDNMDQSVCTLHGSGTSQQTGQNSNSDRNNRNH